jgi:hypothetical protein
MPSRAILRDRGAKLKSFTPNHLRPKVPSDPLWEPPGMFNSNHGRTRRRVSAYHGQCCAHQVLNTLAAGHHLQRSIIDCLCPVCIYIWGRPTARLIRAHLALLLRVRLPTEGPQLAINNPQGQQTAVTLPEQSQGMRVTREATAARVVLPG